MQELYTLARRALVAIDLQRELSKERNFNLKTEAELGALTGSAVGGDLTFSGPGLPGEEK